MPYPRWLAKVNKRVFNPREVRKGERPVAIHVGRSSGTVHQTPLDAHHDEGSYKLTVGEFGTDHVALVVRAFVDPDDPKDLTRVRALQDQIKLKATWAKPY
jgi:hypothetical protein